jgi:hypothetical protein
MIGNKPNPSMLKNTSRLLEENIGAELIKEEEII